MVAIKGMEMPKNCVECKLFHFYFDLDGIVHHVCKYGNVEMCGELKNKRSDFCPLREVENGENPYAEEVVIGGVTFWSPE